MPRHRCKDQMGVSLHFLIVQGLSVSTLKRVSHCGRLLYYVNWGRFPHSLCTSKELFWIMRDVRTKRGSCPVNMTMVSVGIGKKSWKRWRNVAGDISGL